MGAVRCGHVRASSKVQLLDTLDLARYNIHDALCAQATCTAAAARSVHLWYIWLLHTMVAYDERKDADSGSKHLINPRQSQQFKYYQSAKPCDSYFIQRRSCDQALNGGIETKG